MFIRQTFVKCNFVLIYNFIYLSSEKIVCLVTTLISNQIFISPFKVNIYNYKISGPLGGEGVLRRFRMMT